MIADVARELAAHRLVRRAACVRLRCFRRSFPHTEDAVRALRADGCARVAVAPYVIAPGRLPDRIAAGAQGADVLADVLGPSQELAQLLLERYDEARVVERLAATA